MPVQLSRNALDLGIVSRDAAASLKFYRDTLGFHSVSSVPIPGMGLVEKLQCGESYVKILVLDKPADKHALGGGLAAATGIRYFSLSVYNLADVVSECRAAGYKISLEPREQRPGVVLALIEDPDGNTLELMQGA